MPGSRGKDFPIESSFGMEDNTKHNYQAVMPDKFPLIEGAFPSSFNRHLSFKGVIGLNVLFLDSREFFRGIVVTFTQV